MFLIAFLGVSAIKKFSFVVVGAAKLSMSV